MKGVIWILEWLWRLTCGLHGHDMVLRFERDRLSLCCLSCGRRTVGWNLRREVSHRAYAGESRHTPRGGARLIKIFEAFTRQPSIARHLSHVLRPAS
jgi:hypothetical protein